MDVQSCCRHGNNMLKPTLIDILTPVLWGKEGNLWGNYWSWTEGWIYYWYSHGTWWYMVLCRQIFLHGGIAWKMYYSVFYCSTYRDYLRKCLENSNLCAEIRVVKFKLIAWRNWFAETLKTDNKIALSAKHSRAPLLI